MAAYDAGDEALALRLMEQCAEGGDAVACSLAALWCKNGEGAPADPKRSAHWLRLLESLAESGDALAQWELSCRYRWGVLVAFDAVLANRWLERAADGGYAEAQHHLAWYLETGQYDYPVDKARAEQWYELALAQEHPETIYLRAIRQFADGKPTEEAIRLLRKAAGKGFKQASDVLASVLQ